MKRRLILLFCLAFTFSVAASTANGQVLPRNKNRANNANPPATTPQNVERTDAQRDAIPAPPDTPRTQTRARTEVDANVSRTRANARATTNVLRSTQIVGTVVNVQDRRMGQITEIIFNDNGCIDYVVVDLNGRMAPIPWRVGNYDSRTRVFVLDDFDVARIQRIPTFTSFDQLSEQTFVSQVNEYFGVQAESRVEGRGDSVLRSTETERGAATREGTTNTRRTQDQKKTDAAPGRDTEGKATTTERSGKTDQDPKSPGKVDKGDQPPAAERAGKENASSDKAPAPDSKTPDSKTPDSKTPDSKDSTDPEKSDTEAPADSPKN